jgi:hypothetical protein
MKAKKKYEEGGILDKLKEAKSKMQERKQFKKAVKSGKVVKLAETRNGDAAQRSADRNGGIVKYKKGVYTVYKKN